MFSKYSNEPSVSTAMAPESESFESLLSRGGVPMVVSGGDMDSEDEDGGEP